jgi:hypothetical protein
MSNQEIQALLAINSHQGWEFVYDEYSPVMYGSILGLTRNQGLAQQILIEIFRQLHEQNILLTTAPEDWRIKLITYSMSVANQELNRNEINMTDKSKTRWQSVGESLHKIGHLRLVFSAKRTRSLK